MSEGWEGSPLVCSPFAVVGCHVGPLQDVPRADHGSCRLGQKLEPFIDGRSHLVCAAATVGLLACIRQSQCLQRRGTADGKSRERIRAGLGDELVVA